MMKSKLGIIACGTVLLAGLVLPAAVWAGPGVIEINQARALAGGVTAGDAAGFPVTISTPGSYQLTGNLDLTAVTPAVTSAIDVTSDHVTVDLAGHEIAGSVTCSGTPVTCAGSGSPLSSGIEGTGSNVTVKNGTLRGFSFGLRLSSSNGHVIGVRALGNGFTGMQLNGTAGLVVNSTGSGNGDGGILILNGIVTGCTADGNAGTGVYLLGGGVVENSFANSNQTGITLGGGGGTAKNNSVSFNSYIGIYGASGTAIDGNTVSATGIGIGGNGIYAFPGSLVKDNVVSGTNGNGLQGHSVGYAGNVFYNNVNDLDPGGSPISLGPNLCSSGLC